jgi:hypothetical protein
VFPRGGCPVPESPASDTASAVSKRVHEGLTRVAQLRWSGGSLVSFGCQLIDPDIGGCCNLRWLLQFAVTLKVTSPCALDRSIW